MIVVVVGGGWLWWKVDDGCGGRWREVMMEGGCGARWREVVMEGGLFKNITRYEPLIYKFSPPYFLTSLTLHQHMGVGYEVHIHTYGLLL